MLSLWALHQTGLVWRGDGAALGTLVEVGALLRSTHFPGVRMDHREVPIAEAALALRRGYQQTRDLILRGVLAGRQDERGRWLVSRADIDRLVRERNAGEKVPA